MTNAMTSGSEIVRGAVSNVRGQKQGERRQAFVRQPTRHTCKHFVHIWCHLTMRRSLLTTPNSSVKQYTG